MTPWREETKKNYSKLYQDLQLMAPQYAWYLSPGDSPGDSEAWDRPILKIKTLPIHARPRDYQGHYGFTMYGHNLPYLNGWYYHEEVKGKPLNVGVLSPRKIKEWVEYLTLCYEEAVKLSEARKAAVNAFITSFKALERDSKAQYSLSVLQDGCYKGLIIKNGIEFRFEVANNGYISKRLEIHYRVANSLAAFEALSNNDYKGAL